MPHRNAGIGLAASALAGMAMALVVAIATARFHTEHMVTGIAANILALGLTSFLVRMITGGRGSGAADPRAAAGGVVGAGPVEPAVGRTVAVPTSRRSPTWPLR